MKKPRLCPLFSENDSPKGRRKSIQIPAFFFLLAHTPRLRYLKLDGEPMKIAKKAHILDWLSSLMLPIEVLDISNEDLFPPTFVDDLLGIWPTVRALRAFESCRGPPPGRASISLRELRLDAISAIVTAIEQLLPPPPPNEQSILQFLRLYAIPEEARAMLSVHGPSVSTLTLALQPSFEIAHVFTKLEELVIAGPIWVGPLSTFPRTLKHIRLQLLDAGLSYIFMHFSRRFVAAITQELHMLPDLRLISIEKEFAASEHYPDLQKACETHKVEILISSSDSSGKPVVSAYQRAQLQLSATPIIH